ncbi:MAG TPA: hypothetical protein VIA81_07080 [Acidimicrobiia bacterium]|jgi:hypothetical protein
MEPHSDDAIDPDFDDSDPTASDAWDRMADQWKSLGRKLRDTYRESGGEGPTDDEVKAAFRTLGGAWDRLAGAVGSAIKDEQVRDNAKRAATGFFEAVGAAFSELSAELRKSGRATGTTEAEGDGSASDAGPGA